MGGMRMKLLGLEVKGLYGCYDYDVKFNSDITFLYGTNGCGKTTILNITEAIITGQLFKLFNYSFSEISLKYAQKKKDDEVKSIIINSEESNLKINFNGVDYIFNILDLNENISSLKNTREISSYYFNKYDFLFEIKKTFNYVYLPLNRSYITQNEPMDIYSYRFHNRTFIEDDTVIGGDSRDGAMIKIESLIYKNHSKMNSTLNKINDLFRNNILKSQLEVNSTYEITDCFNEIEKTSIPNLRKIQSAYIKILKDLNLISQSEEDDYNNFFSNFIEEFSHFKKSKSSIEAIGMPISLFFKFKEINRIQKTIEIAEKMEERKTSVKKPIETFLNTMNSFVRNNEDEKEICIDNDGQVYFKTKYSNKKISIHHLSSGEKQLITFFANLIFNVDKKSAGIFVVDEPELSLHLSWQKIFIDKVMEIDNDIQLIFATHAPELVGRRRDKMYRLEKKYVEDNKQNG